MVFEEHQLSFYAHKSGGGVAQVPPPRPEFLCAAKMGPFLVSNMARCDQDQGYRHGVSTGPSQSQKVTGAGQHLWGPSPASPGSVPQSVTVFP